MNIKKIKEVLDAEVITDFSDENTDIKYGFASDLMSDALALVKGDSLLITGLNNSQVIRTAEMLDMSTVLFVRGKKPCQEVINLALENRITILATKYTMFTACGILAINGMEGIEADD